MKRFLPIGIILVANALAMLAHLRRGEPRHVVELDGGQARIEKNQDGRTGYRLRLQMHNLEERESGPVNRLPVVENGFGLMEISGGSELRVSRFARTMRELDIAREGRRDLIILAAVKRWWGSGDGTKAERRAEVRPAQRVCPIPRPWSDRLRSDPSAAGSPFRARIGITSDGRFRLQSLELVQRAPR